MPTALPLISGAFSTVAAPTPRHSKCNVSLKPKTLPLSRRDAALLLLITLSPPSSAFALGISGPKDWLKEQKKKSSKFLLAPVDASREILRSAYLLLRENDADYTDQDFEKFQNLFRSAARDCVPQERNSFVSFQANTGVEVCTFRLIVKNAASLLGSKDPVKLKAEALLDDLIRSFTSVSGLAGETTFKLASNSVSNSDEHRPPTSDDTDEHQPPTSDQHHHCECPSASSSTATCNHCLPPLLLPKKDSRCYRGYTIFS